MTDREAQPMPTLAELVVIGEDGWDRAMRQDLATKGAVIEAVARAVLAAVPTKPPVGLPAELNERLKDEGWYDFLRTDPTDAMDELLDWARTLPVTTPPADLAALVKRARGIVSRLPAQNWHQQFADLKGGILFEKEQRQATVDAAALCRELAALGEK